MPPAPPLRKLLGPSFILLGLGLGSGEIILWPYLSANWGLGIAWGAFLGIFFQFFINMEIERYSLARGESVFIGLARRWKWVPFWLMFSTIVSFGWPGIIASSATLFAYVFGGDPTVIGIIFLMLIGIILSTGKYIYTTVESFSKLIILIGVPAICVLTFFFADISQAKELLQGLIGKGNGYWFLPVGIPLASFLAAFAFSGAAGNLNLAQSSYIREKGYGMGSFMEKVKSLFSGKKQHVDLEGFEFDPTEENMKQFSAWWKQVNKEHFLVFFLTGVITVLLLILLSYATTYGSVDNAQGIHFVINEAIAIGKGTFPLLGTLFAVLMAIMLFSTQFTVLDSTSRIISENYAATKLGKSIAHPLSRYYYIFLWTQISFGIIVFLFGLTEPLTLLIISAVLNAFCMFVHIALVNVLNIKELPKEIQASIGRKVVLLIAFLFFGIFSAITLWDKLF
ncbi:MAG: hypothetical protein UV42_C0009G0007 [Candidatus Magasanikbacteria bacterium GW2011_GWE2_42_7]|uniref:Uncharacterized protein n=1 Tax=Candidatus Magasanikbacteria bacterium GW2011_GWE2_42_7 TaxID=1619052 RepID=A0A0G1BG50_9BACT|nr:MAG: hypothetical protein UV42_C0009G0007 [Candidatus Magasanikbacteria bacterium GW2011_GWE2_42_7]